MTVVFRVTPDPFDRRPDRGDLHYCWGRQRDALQVQDRHLAHYGEQLLQVRDMIPTIQAICDRLQIGLQGATFDQRRELVQLLIDCVIVNGEEVEIRYVIPTTEASTHIRFCHLRKDYFDRPDRRDQRLAHRPFHRQVIRRPMLHRLRQRSETP